MLHISNCRNYPHQSQYLARRSPTQLPATLLPSAVLFYRHPNLPGECGFSDRSLPPKAPVDLDLIAAQQPPGKFNEAHVDGFILFFSNTH